MSVRCKRPPVGSSFSAPSSSGLTLRADCGDLGDVVEAIVEAG
jgi:hypothetical protein